MAFVTRGKREHFFSVFKISTCKHDEKAERTLLSKVNEALALGRKKQGYILSDEDKSVRFRTQESINALDSAATDGKISSVGTVEKARRLSQDDPR